MEGKLFDLDQERRFRVEAARVRRRAAQANDTKLSATLIEYANQLDTLQRLCSSLRTTLVRTQSLAADLKELTNKARQQSEK